MTYCLRLTPDGWHILLDGREVMGGSIADLPEARAAVRELNRGETWTS